MPIKGISIPIKYNFKRPNKLWRGYNQLRDRISYNKNQREKNYDEF